MAKDRLLIAPFETGLQTDVKPWLLPDQAFSRLQDAFVYRGRIQKRPGSELQNSSVAAAQRLNYSRLAVQIGTTTPAGALALVNVPGNVIKVGQTFSVGNITITVTALGATATTLQTAPIAGLIVNMVAAAGSDITWGATAGIESLPVYFYPGEPVMGLDQVDQLGVTDELTFGFDTQFGYRYQDGHWEVAGVTPAAWQAAQPAGAAMWTSTNAQFIWSVNYRGALRTDKALYATNNVPLSAAVAPAATAGYNGMKRWNAPVGAGAGTWTNFAPLILATEQIVACLAMISFKGSLFLFNTVKRIGGVDTRDSNRIIWNSFDSDPLDVDAYRRDMNNGAGDIYIPTAEEITSVGKVKDRLIVYCEQSSWEVVYTGNTAKRFIIQQINSELGVESTFSPILFDRAILGVGDRGITANNGTNIERIDEKIPEQVFQIRNADDGPQRVHGIRDYFNECAYWTYPSQTAGYVYPDKVLLYNYRNGSYAILNDSITTFNYDKNIQDRTWAQIENTWEEENVAWNAAQYQNRYNPVLAGNQQGICFKFFNSKAMNAEATYITNMDFTNPNQITLTVIDHNLQNGISFIHIENAQGDNVGIVNNVIYVVRTIVDANTVIVVSNNYQGIAGMVYRGGASFRIVALPQLKSKDFNLYQKDGYNCALEKIEFNVDRATGDAGGIGCSFYTNTTVIRNVNIPAAGQFRSIINFTPYALYPWEATAVSFWRVVYANIQGEYFNFTLGYTFPALYNTDYAFAPLYINAIMLHVSPTSSRFQ